MHCPRCGQQQVNDQTRFCSRCGFLMSVVADVVAHGGSLPELDRLNQGKKKWLTRKNGVGFSLIWFVFFLLIVTPFWGIVGVEELAGLSAIFAIFGGLIWLLFSLFFLESSKPVGTYHQAMPQPVNLAGNAYGQGALPPQQANPVSNYAPPQSSQPVPQHVAGSWRDTNDLLSISDTHLGTSDTREEATRRLNKDEEKF